MSMQPLRADGREVTDLPARPVAAEFDFERFLKHATETQGVESFSLRQWLDLAETWKITRTLSNCRGNRSAAARALGIGRRTLYAKMEKLQITPTWGTE